MVAVEYLGGLPGRESVASIAVSVQDDTLRLKHGRLFGGWSYQVPLTTITSAEVATAREVQASGLLAATVAAKLDQPQERLLMITVPVDDRPTTIVLRGSWAMVSDLRQAILQGRMRAAKQWHA